MSSSPLQRSAAALIAALLFLSLLFRSPLLFLLAALLLLVAAATWLWQTYGLSEVTYARRFDAERLFCGESTTLWVEVVNAKPLPLPWLKAEDEFPANLTVENLALGQSSKPQRRSLTTLMSLRWYERVRRRYHVRAEQRGAFEFGPVLLTTGDLFGFRQQSRALAESQTLIVYPKLVPVTGWTLPAARPGGEHRTERRVIPEALRLAGVRDYAPGDSYRHVHWKATARRGQLQTKVFDPSAAHQIMIGVNSQTLERAFEGVLPDWFETVMTVAASVAQAALDDRRPVGLFSNSSLRASPGYARVPVARHPAQLATLLETLAYLTDYTPRPFEHTLRHEASRLPYGASLVLISAILTDALCAACLDLREAGHPITLILMNVNPTAVSPALAAAGITTHFVNQTWKDLETLALD
jgi:uncharacterized protein (DUF58 family)